jgi:DNA-binding transcriptional regulator PaaX
MNTAKLNEAIEKLSEIDESYSDLFEEMAVLVSDIGDCIKSTHKSQFMNQKRDARITLKHFTRRFINLTFKNK